MCLDPSNTELGEEGVGNRKGLLSLINVTAISESKREFIGREEVDSGGHIMKYAHYKIQRLIDPLCLTK